MALPRPVLLGILGLLLIVATFMATHTLKHNGTSSSSPPITTTVAPAKKTSTATATKQSAVAKTTTQSSTKAKHATQTAKAKTPSATALGMPSKVAQALAQHKVLVLYFGANGADDTLTADSVRALKTDAKKGVAVFLDKLSNLSDYRRVVEGLDVSQAPSIVIVDHSRKAQVLEGYIDAGSLRQAVADVAG
jgi:hypothetical protein